ncbi:MAG: autotransporter-associated beta strand repeat-containing protein, partial [Verrucomicrobiaceae bacterium]
MKTRTPLFRIDRLFLAALALLAVPHLHAQTTYTMTNQANASTWLTTNNWQTNGVASTSRPDTNSIARFTNSTTTSVGLNLNTSNTISSGSLLMGGTGTLTLSNSSGAAGGQLRLFGTGADTNLIVNTNTGTLILTNGTSQAMDLQLGTSGTINVSNSSGNVTIFSLIKQDSGETNGFNKTGAGTLTIAGTNSNTYSGLTTLSAGTLRFNKTAGQNVSAGDILVSGGNLVLSSSNQMSDTMALTNAGGT